MKITFIAVILYTKSISPRPEFDQLRLLSADGQYESIYSIWLSNKWFRLWTSHYTTLRIEHNIIALQIH